MDKNKCPKKCPKCGSNHYNFEFDPADGMVFGTGKCRDCGFEWTEYYPFDEWEEA